MTCFSASSRKSVTYMNTGIFARNFCSFSRISLRSQAVSRPDTLAACGVLNELLKVT
jgi:hypothetical protein